MTTAARSKPQRRQDTRERLLQAAQLVFARHGYDRATVDEIVREAGFSKGAFYVHFASKEDLFWEMLDERIRREQEAFRRAVDARAPVVENVRTVLSAVFALVEEDPLWPAMLLEFWAHAGRNEKVRRRLADMYRRWRDLTVEILAAGQEAGRVRKDIDVEFVASVLVAMVEGSIMQSHLAPESVRLAEMVEPLSQTVAEWLERR